MSFRAAPLVALALLSLVAPLSSGACTLVVDTRADQCADDGECAAKGAAFAGSVCVAGACTELACTGG